nr:cell division FtsA domain-containing protein [bacterium]
MKQAVMVVDFGASKISCMIGTASPGARSDAEGVSSVPYAGYSAGRWMDPAGVADAVYDAVRTAQQRARHRMRDVYIVVPGDYTRVVCGKSGAQITAKDNRVSREDIERLIRSTEGVYRPDRYKVIHRSMAYYSLDEMGRVENPVGQRGRKLGGLIGYVLADTLFLKDAQAICDELGLSIRGYVASSLGQGMSYIPVEARARMAALVDVGYASTQVALFQGEGMIYHETLPVGGRHIVSDLATGLEVSLDEAEMIKRRYVFGMTFTEDSNLKLLIEKDDRITRFDYRLVHDIIEARVEEISEMVGNALAGCGFRLGARTPVYLSGGGLAMMRGARPFITTQLGRPVQVITPHTAAMNTPNHAALAGAVDYILAYTEESRPGGIRSALRRFFTR